MHSMSILFLVHKLTHFQKNDKKRLITRLVYSCLAAILIIFIWNHYRRNKIPIAAFLPNNISGAVTRWLYIFFKFESLSCGRNFPRATLPVHNTWQLIIRWPPSSFHLKSISSGHNIPKEAALFSQHVESDNQVAAILFYFEIALRWA